MDLTIIIVNWNTKELLRNCLRSIAANQSGLSVQTIVVDNNSKDSSREMVAKEFPHVQLINSGGNIGFARANNLAVPGADSDLILFLNPDTEAQPGALSKMAEVIHGDPSIGILGCKIRDRNGALQPLGLQWFPSPFTELVKFLGISDHTFQRRPRYLPFHDPEQSGFVNKLFGACLLVRKSAFVQAGGFDERFFMYCEDVDLCHRILSAGWRIYYSSEAEILHLGASASSSVPGAFSVLMMCESFSEFMRKHHGRSGRAAYRLVTLLGAQVRIALLLLMWLIRLAKPRDTRKTIEHSVRKYLTIMAWALGLRRPIVHG